MLVLGDFCAKVVNYEFELLVLCAGKMTEIEA
jgi:hypothetical protein